jgi:hypothetical protein
MNNDFSSLKTALKDGTDTCRWQVEGRRANYHADGFCWFNSVQSDMLVEFVLIFDSNK